MARLAHSTGRSRFKRIWDRALGAGVALRINHVLALTSNELSDIRALWTQFGHRRAPTQFSILANGVNPDEFAGLPDPDEFRQRYQLDDAPVALYMGRLQQRKGVDILARAFQRADVGHARLLIVGPDEGMLAAIQSLSAGDSRIVCTGYLDGDERRQALAACGLFALPAVGEGLPMAVLEAMASGMPVVISPGCNLPEVAAAGAGFVVDADVDAFAEKLRLLLTRRDLRVDMGAKARRLVQANYQLGWHRGRVGGSVQTITK